MNDVVKIVVFVPESHTNVICKAFDKGDTETKGEIMTCMGYSPQAY